MKKALKRKPLLVLALTVIFTFGIGGTVMATELSVNDLIVPSDVSIASADTEFTLDFDESDMWTFDFDNDGFGPFNDDEVEVFYSSHTPTSSFGLVAVELFVKHDGDDVYEPVADDDSYTISVTPGGTISMSLPEGGTMTNYRLVFSRQTSTLESGTFSVKTM